MKFDVHWSSKFKLYYPVVFVHFEMSSLTLTSGTFYISLAFRQFMVKYLTKLCNFVRTIWKLLPFFAWCESLLAWIHVKRSVLQPVLASTLTIFLDRFWFYHPLYNVVPIWALSLGLRRSSITTCYGNRLGSIMSVLMYCECVPAVHGCVGCGVHEL